MIQLRNVSKKFQKNESISVVALSDVTLDIKPGEFVAVIFSKPFSLAMPCTMARLP